MASSLITVEYQEQRLNAAVAEFLRDRLPDVVDMVARRQAFQVIHATTKGLTEGPDGLPKRVDTGRLRAGWRVAAASAGLDTTGLPGSPGSKATDGAGSMSATPTRVEITLSNNVEYATFVEEGTARMRPGHHLKRGLRLAADDIVDIMPDEMRAAWEGKR